GYAIDWAFLASRHLDDFSFVSELPFNAGWQQDNVMWEHAVIPLSKSDSLLGYVLVEVATPDKKKRLRSESFDWLRRDAAFQLKCKLLAHQLAQVRLSKHQNELDLALNNRTLSSQLTYLKSLHEISLRFTKATSIHSLCRIAIELGRDRLQIDRMGIFLCDLEKDKMWGTWGTDPHGNVVDRSDFCQEMPNTLFMEEAFTTKNELIVKENVPLYFGREQVGIGWNVMMVMWNGDECIGWLAADNLIYRSVLDEPKKEAIKLLAASVCQKINKLRETELNNQRLGDLEKMNTHQEHELVLLRRKLEMGNQLGAWSKMIDPVTELPNEKYLALSLPQIVSDSRRQNGVLAVISIEVDFFRGYQKLYGENEASNLLRSISILIEENTECYSFHVCAATAPGEFMILVQYENEVHLREMTEALVNSMYHRNIRNRASAIYQRVTLSVGAVLGGGTLFNRTSRLLKNAEKQRLMARKLGRNRICID
ncbi:GGDEF domain-containing protein, partial [Enterovibrio makurazakiensis]|uniref:GGDEF domain-containing protein n=1 Tax=Enterovibrio makurazakiensis TaxID=2910232 RepID=UPI003D1B2E75